MISLGKSLQFWNKHMLGPIGHNISYGGHEKIHIVKEIATRITPFRRLLRAYTYIGLFTYEPEIISLVRYSTPV